MSASLLIRKALREKGISQKELAELSGLSYQTIRTKLYRDNMPFADAEKILNLLGYDICIIDKETKKPLL